jgi:hypothetical protein
MASMRMPAQALQATARVSTSPDPLSARGDHRRSQARHGQILMPLGRCDRLLIVTGC